ncbi:MAG TPA: GNAT family N-acetyltransferase [Actinomycetota bacterium]|jgi:ribosomal protein S18 acetylase RimI-like enzyme
MVVEVRAVVAGEWERVRDLRLRALADAPDAFGSTLELERDHDESAWIAWVQGWEGARNRFLVAETAESWLGMAVGSREAGEVDAHLYGMWVEPAWRRRGVGRALVDGVVEWARADGVRALVLGVTEGNDGAADLYSACGFVDTGERHPLRDGSRLRMRVYRLEL